MSCEPSLVRLALDELLRRYPMFDLVSIDWQLGSKWYDDEQPGDPQTHTGPWVLVKLGQPSSAFEEYAAWATWPFAIWKTTGALHSMSDGAVSDDPIWTPT